jgi:hypothetical protein
MIQTTEAKVNRRQGGDGKEARKLWCLCRASAVLSLEPLPSFSFDMASLALRRERRYVRNASDNPQQLGCFVVCS